MGTIEYFGDEEMKLCQIKLKMFNLCDGGTIKDLLHYVKLNLKCSICADGGTIKDLLHNWCKSRQNTITRQTRHQYQYQYEKLISWYINF